MRLVFKIFLFLIFINTAQDQLRLLKTTESKIIDQAISTEGSIFQKIFQEIGTYQKSFGTHKLSLKDHSLEVYASMKNTLINSTLGKAGYLKGATGKTLGGTTYFILGEKAQAAFKVPLALGSSKKLLNGGKIILAKGAGKNWVLEVPLTELAP